MSDFAKLWGDEYNKCSQPLQGKGSLRTVESRTVLEGTGPLLKCLVAIDKADPIPVRDPKEREKVHGVLVKELKSFKTEAAKYGKAIDAALKTTSKDTHKDAYRALKSLRAHLDVVVTKIEHHANVTSKDTQKALDKAGERTDKEYEAARKKGLSDEQVNEEVDYAKQLKSLVQFSTAAKSAVARAKAAVQAIKSDPTPATYNQEMDTGGRNYTQQISNLVKLSKDSKCPPKVKALLNGIDGYKNELDAYGNGAKRRVADTATPADINKLLKEYVQLVKDTYPYAESLMDYLKKHKLK